MTVRDSNAKKKPVSVLDADSEYDDLDLQSIIKKLDEATAESFPPPDQTFALTARPAADAAAEPQAIELTERVESAELTELTDHFELDEREEDGPEVIDLVDELEAPALDLEPLERPAVAEVSGCASRRNATVAELSAGELADIIEKAVEGALRRFYSRV
ncbi:MAG: hypothetical protein LBU12_07515 [Deltaproteobacteria bacterium]|jgi:hypothetical protein|nr:hypothetical protein [Deltaproteobacteria bacterium]